MGLRDLVSNLFGDVCNAFDRLTRPSVPSGLADLGSDSFPAREDLGLVVRPLAYEYVPSSASPCIGAPALAWEYSRVSWRDGEAEGSAILPLSDVVEFERAIRAQAQNGGLVVTIPPLPNLSNQDLSLH